MAGRALAFSDREIIRWVSEYFVPVAGDDWYQRRRQDAEGEFLRKVAEQGPRKDTPTKQGIYFLTADGKLLIYSNAGQDPAALRDALKQALAAWKKLPAGHRQPGAVKVAEAGKADATFTREPPKNGLILNVHTRILERDTQGTLQCGKCSFPGGEAAARDHLWLTEAEWKSLIPANPKPGVETPLPARLAERILRFHLVDNTRGEPAFWKKEEIRSQSLRLRIDAVDDAWIHLQLYGSALLATDADASRAQRGYDVRLHGLIRVDRKLNRADRFDVVALGDHWGQGPYTRGARPGRTPLGIAFELARNDSAADRVPPQGAREIGDYLGR